MNFIRRIFGLPANTPPSSPHDDGISITQDDSLVVKPPEPVIEAPPAEKKDGASLTPTSAMDGKVVSVEEELTPVLGPLGSKVTDPAGTRPLPPLETIVPQPGQRLVFGQFSDVGRIRGNNQDAMFSFVSTGISSENLPDLGVFVVADGMGGHHDGEKASAITVRLVMRYVVQHVYDYILQQKMDDPERPTVADVLREAVQKANEAIAEEIPEGGTTVTLSVILGDLVYIAHVGDSRAYLLTGEGIEQITRDHSLVQRLIELDQLTPEEAAEHPQRNVLYRAIGQNDHLDVDAITRRLPPGSRLLLCSDGLWNLVPEDDILSIATASADPQSACSKLVQLANERGGSDNITVILVKMPG